MTTTLDKPYESIWTHLSTTAFRQDWINVNGVKTRYAQSGDAANPAVIMLHGLGGTWEAYCATLGALGKHFNCFAIDFMGSGYSDKPDHDYQIADYVGQVRGFMDAVGVKKAAIIGISLGAWVTARFAISHPDLTEKIILNAAFGLSDDEEEIAGILTRRTNAYDNPNWQNIKTIFDGLMFNKEKSIDDLVALRRATYSTPSAKAASGHVLSLFRREHLPDNLIPPEDWKKIKAPAMVVVSLRDRPLFLNTARTVSELIPNATALEMDDVGHWPQFENPEVFNREAIAFLKS